MMSLGIRMFQRPYRSVARRVFLLSGSILIEGNERSRYKVRMRASCYPRLQSDLCALVQCRGTRLNPRQLLSPVTDFSFGQRRESGFISSYSFIQVQKAPQKP